MNSQGMIITGMHRSGTSLTAQIFFRAGLFLGDYLSSPKSPNPDGYFEDKEFSQFHDRVLGVNNTRWHNCHLLKKGMIVPPECKSEAISLINRKFQEHQTWGWKDPRATLFLALWQEILPDAKFVFVYRRPGEVVWSLIRRGDFRIYSKSLIRQALDALRLWDHYNRQIVEFVGRHRTSVLLTLVPDDLVNQEVQTVIANVIQHKWAFELEELSKHMSQTYKPTLIQHEVPRWIRVLTKVYLPAAITFHRLNRLHEQLLFQYSGKSVFSNLRQQPDQEENTRSVVCIISPNKYAYSETFIRAHIERLPAKVRVLYGGSFPSYRDDDIPLLPPPNLPRRLLRAIRRRVLRLPSDHFKKTALKRFLQANRVDVVLAENGPVGVAVMDVCKEAGVPLIVYFRGSDAYSHLILEQVGQHYPKLFENAAAIFVVSRDMERHLLLNLGAPREKLYYNPSGVDTTLFQGADPAHAPPVFVAVSRFVDKKGPHLTLLVFNKVVDSVPDAQLIMIGDGPLWEACKQLARALGIAGAVEFLGPRAHAEVAATIRRARALVQHSITASYGDSEGTPNAVKEAGASGLPVVATRHGGIPDIVIDGKTGFLVDEGDVEGMAEYMTQLAKDPVLAAQLGKAARDWVCAEFSMEKSIGKLWRVIEAITQEHGNRK